MIGGATSMTDPYKALGVNKGARPEEIKRAYRRLAKEYHPDRTGGDKHKEARFKEISTAYEILGDPARRAEYDAMRASPRFSEFTSGPGAMDLGEFFAQVFGRGSSAGHGVEYQVFTGDREPRSGADPWSGFANFPGAGPRRGASKRPPPARPRKIRASDGSTLILDGHDVRSDVHIDYDQAILGTVVEVPTVSGVASVKIPPGTPSGTKLRLRGKGARRAGGQRGDHLVCVQIRVPKKLDREATELLHKLMRRVRK